MKRVTILCFSIVLASFASVASISLKAIDKLPLPPRAIGPEALAFDTLLGGPYTGVADGRILKYEGPNIGFQDYAFLTSNRSKAVCDGYDGNFDTALGPTCGRPLGLGFNKITGELYIADIYLGLLVVRRNGKFAQQVATSSNGILFGYTNGLDVDQLTGTVYFTDSIAREGNISSGRVLKYDPNTGAVTTLVSGLTGASGLAVSIDGTYLLFSEAVAGRVTKYWLKGLKANTTETVISLPGTIDNIKSTSVLGVYWVPVNQPTSPNLTFVPWAYLITSSGTVLERFSLTDQFNSTFVTEVQQRGSILYAGSVFTNFVARYMIVY